MKCPKCGYMSFDFNQVCPKCNKEITGERDKLSLPSYRPSPPSLLGALTGDTSDSQIGLSVDEAGGYESAAEAASFTPEDSQAIEAMEETFEDGQGIEMDIEDMPGEGGGGLSSDLEDLIIDTSDMPAAGAEQAPEEDAVSLDLDSLELDTEPSSGGAGELDLEIDTEIEAEPDAVELSSEPVESDDKTMSLDLGDISEEESLADLIDEGAEGTDSETLAETEEGKDEITSLDLEDLELDLDLDEPEGKSS